MEQGKQGNYSSGLFSSCALIWWSFKDSPSVMAWKPIRPSYVHGNFWDKWMEHLYLQILTFYEEYDILHRIKWVGNQHNQVELKRLGFHSNLECAHDAQLTGRLLLPRSIQCIYTQKEPVWFYFWPSLILRYLYSQPNHYIFCPGDCILYLIPSWRHLTGEWLWIP